MTSFLKVLMFGVMLSLVGLNYWVFQSGDTTAIVKQEESKLLASNLAIESGDGIEQAAITQTPNNVVAVAASPTTEKKRSLAPIEEIFIAHKLVDIASVDPTIQVDLKYASVDNFMKKNVYGAVERCYLQKDVAKKLSKAQEYLKEKKPQYSIVIFDGARPKSVQQEMWDLVKGTDAHKYVASPNHGSIHNYGAAVDVSLVDADGKELDMGTDYDFFGDLAQPRYEVQFSKTGELMPNQLANRILLREIMKKAGFKGILSEWWHFESDRLEQAKKKYHVIK